MPYPGLPVLSKILAAIIKEEAAHTHFYRSVARIELAKNETAQKIARKVIDTFWRPVGQGSLSRERSEYCIATLFSGAAAYLVAMVLVGSFNHVQSGHGFTRADQAD